MSRTCERVSCHVIASITRTLRRQVGHSGEDVSRGRQVASPPSTPEHDGKSSCPKEARAQQAQQQQLAGETLVLLTAATLVVVVAAARCR